jgi:hypothetical protein
VRSDRMRLNEGCTTRGIVAGRADRQAVTMLTSIFGAGVPRRRRRRTTQQRRHSPAPDLDARMRDALTELHAYALVLDSERQRTVERIDELTCAGEDTGELAELRRRRSEITAQLRLLHATITALRERADPTGSYL